MAAMAKHDDVDKAAGTQVGRPQDARMVVTGIAAIALGWFAVANLGSVTIDFWVHHSRAPLILVILISGMLGALIATLVLRRRVPKD